MKDREGVSRRRLRWLHANHLRQLLLPAGVEAFSHVGCISLSLSLALSSSLSLARSLALTLSLSRARAQLLLLAELVSRGHNTEIRVSEPAVLTAVGRRALSPSA